MEITVLFTMLLSGGLMFGLIGVADVFASVFWGNDFVTSGYLIIGMAPAFVFSVVGNVVRTQYLIPRSRDKEYTLSLISGSVVNVLINLFLIPKYGSIGAVVGTLIAEFVMTFIQIYVVRKELSILKNIRDGLPFFVNGFIMYIVIRWIRYYLGPPSLVNLMVLITAGATVYIVSSFLLLIFTRNRSLQEVFKLLFKRVTIKLD